MKRFSSSVVLVALALAGCSGGHSAVVPGSGTVPASATRATRSVTGTDAFTYVTNPPHIVAPFHSGTAIGPSLTTAECSALFQTSATFQCYTPQDIRTGYDVPATLTGAGQTIVIIDAYGSATIQQDAATFSTIFGLPPPVINQLTPDGPVDPSADPTGSWAGETTLDVEWAHAIAPNATIDLVLAPTNSGTDLEAVEKYAIAQRLGNVMTMSFGAPELNNNGTLDLEDHFLSIDLLYAQANAEGMSLFASSGDAGATDGTPNVTANFPASDPHVVAVGGTDLFLAADGTYRNEYTWNDTDPATCPFDCDIGIHGATGGAPSKIFPGLTQIAFSHDPFRTTNDVAYDASVYTGVLVVETIGGTQYIGLFGGTSAGSPQWAGIAALADQQAGHGLGWINPLLYAASVSHPGAFHDITVGNNNVGGGGFNAGPGYDIPTGLGSPDVAKLLTALH